VNKQVVVELCASNEECCSEFVQEDFYQIGCGIRKKKPTKDEVRAMTVKVVEMMRKSEEQEVLITSMEKEVKDILELIGNINFVPNDTRSKVVEVEPLSVDHTYFKKPESSHEDKDEEKDLHGDEDQPNEEVNMFPKMEHEPRKRFKTVVLKTPWTTYSMRKPKNPQIDA